MPPLQLVMSGSATHGKPSVYFSIITQIDYVANIHRDIDEHDELAKKNPLI